LKLFVLSSGPHLEGSYGPRKKNCLIRKYQVMKLYRSGDWVSCCR